MSSSAYFEYYKDDLFGILDSRPATLFEMNVLILNYFLRKIGISADLRMTEEYVPARSREIPVETGRYGTDYRELIHPKRPDNILRNLRLEKPYFQVFAGKYGFVPNLSIMDLLFNEGPDFDLLSEKSLESPADRRRDVVDVPLVEDHR